MQLYRGNIVRKREHGKKTHWVWRLLVLADSVDNAKARIITEEHVNPGDEIYVRPIEDGECVFKTGGYSLTPAELEKHRKLYNGEKE